MCIGIISKPALLVQLVLGCGRHQDWAFECLTTWPSDSIIFLYFQAQHSRLDQVDPSSNSHSAMKLNISHANLSHRGVVIIGEIKPSINWGKKQDKNVMNSINKY